MEYYLKPFYDSRKSFYCKATVKHNNNEKMLFSYDYFIGSIFDNDNNIFLFNDNFLNDSCCQSLTTLRHIREFLRQNGIKKIGILCEHYKAIEISFDFRKSDLYKLIEANS